MTEERYLHATTANLEVTPNTTDLWNKRTTSQTPNRFKGIGSFLHIL
ncbi:MAG: hypothetical protein OES34_10305 [Nitrosopumilus sp.]|nr:hypothetical protein [Nitrosopumilus sp.]